MLANDVDEFMKRVIIKNPGEYEFHQAVQEVATCLIPFIKKNPRYRDAKILERMVEPERVIMFRVSWEDDQGEIQINRGFRVQMNSAIGPFKGGLRFHPSVTLSIMKALSFEQTLKNSLTTLPMGGAKGGSDFDPRGKTDNEVMLFCQAFMNELFHHIGPDTDVPAGDIGVGGREVGYLFGQYKKLTKAFCGVLTGKGRAWGGSLIRPEATGYGISYFLEEMLKTKGESVEGKTILASGYGNVGTFFIEKINELGGKVVTISDECGYVYDPDGIKGDKLEFLKDLWVVHRKPAKAFADEFGLKWVEGKKPWEVPCDIACPTATQNEIDVEDAKTLLKNGCWCAIEAANMPCTNESINLFLDAGILFAPAKAANAGGVAVSGLEMTQNSMRYNWSREEVDQKLKQIMQDIHRQCVSYGKHGEYTNYVQGANISGFVKVAEAMIQQGLV
ncbi:MAG: NADP-specific glutamate dehydrogenase [Desulfitobacteriaceae bacterium]|nr:NADP-specific glutamate dehydrogenase [Desulfitobacteriaceae bacterium]MDD4753008.1 NADP-specific glutamate dehydrogenase [Desulfitobacteriaceae bacterium]